MTRPRQDNGEIETVALAAIDKRVIGLMFAVLVLISGVTLSVVGWAALQIIELKSDVAVLKSDSARHGGSSRGNTNYP